MNHFLEIDPNAKNVNDEFLLSLSGLVPLEQLMRRLQSVRGINFKPYVDLAEYESTIKEKISAFLTMEKIHFDDNGLLAESLP